MKNKIFFILLFVPLYLQAQKMPMDFLAEGNRFYAEGNYDNALMSYGYIINNYNYSDEYAMAVYNTAVVFEKKKDFLQSLKFYKTVLQGAFDNQVMLGGKSIMDNPYANFSFNSCMNIGGIYFEIEKFDSALTFYTLADTSDLLITDCGNAVSEVHYDLVVKRAQCLINLKDSQNAIMLLAKNIFSDGFASVKNIVDLLIQILNEKYSKQKIQNSLEKSIQNIEKENKIFYIKLFGAKVRIYDSERPFYKDFTTEEEALKTVLNHRFFKTYLE